MAAAAAKTDNGNLAAKLKLRRHFLREYHGPLDPPNVMDCCQATGRIWSALRRDFPLAGYWGVDVKSRKGRLKIDSVRILEQPGWDQNVIDIDTYGSPWKHWVAMLPNVVRPLTVFLTIGQWQMGTDRKLLETLGVGGLKVPPGIAVRLHGRGATSLLGSVADHGLKITNAMEAIHPDNMARYIGLRLVPASQ